jgi:hypothetical protein
MPSPSLRWQPRLFSTLAFAVVLTACGGGSSPAPGQQAAGASSAQRGAAQLAGQLNGSQTVRGRIFGLGGAIATVILGDQAQVMMTTLADADGRFEFSGVPYGTFFVKAEAKGLAMSPAQVVTVNAPTVLSSFGALSQILPAPAGLTFSAASSSIDNFSFHWDTTSGGQESAAHIVVPPVIQFRSEPITSHATVPAGALLATYNIVLSDDGVKWTSEAAARLLATLGTLPRGNSGSILEPGALRLSKWVLTDQFIADDIKIERADGGDKVTLSSAALVYATPRLVYLDGVPGRYFSKRLHHAALRFATKDGSDTVAAEYILTQRFGVSTQPNFQQLTANTTHEGPGQFAPFRPDEMLLLISTLEEMPEGFYKIAGLKYLVRRAYGHFHPSDKAIIAQAHTTAGYIEFTDEALVPAKAAHVILHEKTHFLWADTMSAQVKNDWAALGGWARSPANTSTWFTTRSTGFVSDYAHAVSPDEDMAESVADYILNPGRLQSRASDKFNFIKARIFQGDRYVPVMRDDLTFTVFDLAPDYIAPGKARSVDITLKGAPNETKFGSMTIELFGDSSPSAGARECWVTLRGPNRSDGLAFPMYPVGPGGKPEVGVNRTRLTGLFGFNRFATSGYWTVEQVVCTDITGNRRQMGTVDVGGAAVYVNSPQQFAAKPQYEAGSLKIVELTPVTVQGHRFKRVQASWRIKPHDLRIQQAWAGLTDMDQWYSSVAGTFVYDQPSRTVTFTYVIPDYFPNGRYGLHALSMADEAGNINWFNFPNAELNEAPSTIALVNDRPDSGSAPEMDVNRISVSATPVRPAAPDGETIVKVAFYVRDDVSGFNKVLIVLLNPQGELNTTEFKTTAVAGKLENTNEETLFFSGDPTQWQRYEATIVLPVGSVPGKWGVIDMHLNDKAGMGRSYNFVELVHFVVTDK